jgi:ribosomal protein S10
MRFARDFNGFLVDAETINEHGNYICPLCHNLAHWRKRSIDERRPHFYHAEANEECPLSVIGGKWTIRGDEDVSFSSGSPGGEELIFPRKAKPDLSKIPRELTEGPNRRRHMSGAVIKIRLLSSDVTQIDRTVAVLCDFLREEKSVTFLVIPLPAVLSKALSGGAIKPRIHKRIVKIIGAKSVLIEELTRLTISENVDILIDVT